MRLPCWQPIRSNPCCACLSSCATQPNFDSGLCAARRLALRPAVRLQPLSASEAARAYQVQPVLPELRATLSQSLQCDIHNYPFSATRAGMTLSISCGQVHWFTALASPVLERNSSRWSSPAPAIRASGHGGISAAIGIPGRDCCSTFLLLPRCLPRTGAEATWALPVAAQQRHRRDLAGRLPPPLAHPDDQSHSGCRVWWHTFIPSWITPMCLRTYQTRVSHWGGGRKKLGDLIFPRTYRCLDLCLLGCVNDATLN